MTRAAMGAEADRVDDSKTLRVLLDAGDGLVTRQQLRAAGLGQRWVRRQIAAGTLARVLPSVLRCAETPVDHGLRIRAGLLHAGPDAALTHTTALWNWGLLEEFPAAVHVCVPRGKSQQIGWLHVHVHSRREVSACNGLPTVSPADALAAAAVDLSLDDMRFPTMEASRLKLLCADDLIAGRSRNMLGKLRTLAEEVEAGAESGGEAKYWRLLHDSHLPTPQLQKWVLTHDGSKRLDGYWEQFLLGVEIDGRRFHGTPEAFERDSRRQNGIHATGVAVIRFSVNAVMTDSDYVLEDTEANMEARRALLEGRLRRV